MDAPLEMDQSGNLVRIRGEEEDSRSYTDDAYKSLDEIVHDRGIRKPQEKGLCSERAERVRMTDGKLNDYDKSFLQQLKIRNLDPMAHGLDELIEKDKRSLKSETLKPLSERRDLDPLTHGLDDLIVKERRASKSKETIERNDKKNALMKRKLDPESDSGNFKRRSKVNFAEEVLVYGEESGEDEDEAGNNEGNLMKPSGHTWSAYRAVGFLSEKGLIISVVIGSKEVKEGADDSRRWRCIVSSGDFEGICDSKRKVVAREMASKEFLDKLKQEYPDAKIPKYEVSEDLLTDPKIFKILECECTEAVRRFFYNVIMQTNNQGVDTYRCIIIVDDERFSAEDVNEATAKMQAAKKAYKFVTGTEFPDTKYYVGDQCDKSVEYIFTESEVHQFAERSLKAIAAGSI